MNTWQFCENVRDIYIYFDRARDCNVSFACSSSSPSYKLTTAINHKYLYIEYTIITYIRFIKVWQRNACSDKSENMTTKNWWRYLTFPAFNRRDFWCVYHFMCWRRVTLTLFSPKQKNRIGHEILCMKYVCKRRVWWCRRIVVSHRYEDELLMLLLFVKTVIGGWANNRTLIRRRRQDLDLATEYTFNVLRKDEPLKILIEISTGKYVNIWSERWYGFSMSSSQTIRRQCASIAHMTQQRMVWQLGVEWHRKFMPQFRSDTP